MTQVTIKPGLFGALSYYGSFSETNFYKIDLSQAGLSNIRSIQIHDDGFLASDGGKQSATGSGAASGFDLDFVEINTSTSNDPVTSVNPATVVGGVFNYTTGVTFRPGMLNPYVPGQPSLYNSQTLLGAFAGDIYSPTFSTLGSPDGFVLQSTGRLALGEGGSVTFTLSAPVSSGTLIIGDVFDFTGQNTSDGFYIVLSDQPTIAQDVGLTLTVPTAVGITGEGGVINLSAAENAVQGAGPDSITGAGLGDQLNGGGGDDYVRGLDGDDTVNGGTGNDDVNGNVGQDIVHGDAGNDTVRGGMGNDLVYGDDGDDGHVNGNIGNDTVSGGEGNDTVYGGQNNDSLMGDNGNDWLSGDLGNDTMTGGAGADRFLFRVGSGNDVVTDFSYAAGDRVQLPVGTGFQMAFAPDGSAQIILTSSGETLNLTGVVTLPNDGVVFV